MLYRQLSSRSVGFALALVWRAAPLWTIANVGLVVVQGALPLLWLYAIRRFVDAVTFGVGAPPGAHASDAIALWAAAAAAAGLVTAVARSAHEFASEALSIAVTDSVADLVQAQSAAADLASYEDPAYHDIVFRVQSLALFRPARILSGLLEFGQCALAVVSVCALLVTLDWRLLLLLFPAVVPAGLARGMNARRLHQLARRQSEDERRAWYFHSVLTDQDVVACQGFQMAMANLHAGARSAAQFYEDALFLDDLRAFLAIVPSIRASEHPVAVQPSVREGVALDAVSFTYPGTPAPALDRVSLRIGVGEVVALVGPNGCGKSTIVKLLSRLYDPTSGRVTADGVDLRDVDPPEWREQVSVLFQDFVRYQGSVSDNVAPGAAAAEDLPGRVVRAASAAGAAALVDRLPGAYESTLGTWFAGGRDLSTGEWQRLALARALFRRSSVLILDEPLAHLDPAAQSDLLRRFRHLASGKAVLLVSHYLPAVAVADRGYEMDGGRIVRQSRGDQFVAAHWPFELERGA